MSYTIISEICEGKSDCIPVCPVDCIHWTQDDSGANKKNEKGFEYPNIDSETCIDCGACLAACPIEGAIIDEWKPELQKL